MKVTKLLQSASVKRRSSSVSQQLNIRSTCNPANPRLGFHYVREWKPRCTQKTHTGAQGQAGLELESGVDSLVIAPKSKQLNQPTGMRWIGGIPIKRSNVQQKETSAWSMQHARVAGTLCSMKKPEGKNAGCWAPSIHFTQCRLPLPRAVSAWPPRAQSNSPLAVLSKALLGLCVCISTLNWII